MPGSVTRRLAILVSASLALSSCGIRLPAPQAPAAPTRPAASGDARPPHVLVWLIADNLHTGMVFEYDWLLESGFVPPDGFGNPKYVTLSWGDLTAYQEGRLDTPWEVFRALFLPTASVMELIPIDWHVTEVCPHQRIWRKLVPREKGPELAAFLNHCSRTTPGGKPVVLGPSSWGGGVLLASRHSYYFPRICNVWTAQSIEAIGGKINPWTAISANGLIRQAETPANDFEQIWWGGGTRQSAPES